MTKTAALFDDIRPSSTNEDAVTRSLYASQAETAYSYQLARRLWRTPKTACRMAIHRWRGEISWRVRWWAWELQPVPADISRRFTGCRDQNYDALAVTRVIYLELYRQARENSHHG